MRLVSTSLSTTVYWPPVFTLMPSASHSAFYSGALTHMAKANIATTSPPNLPAVFTVRLFASVAMTILFFLNQAYSYFTSGGVVKVW